jgi:hypothetical protein
MNTSVENSALPYLRRVVRKGPYLKTCLHCFERKPAYVVSDDICTSCRATTSQVLAFHSDN